MVNKYNFIKLMVHESIKNFPYKLFCFEFIEHYDQIY